jgi:hypothetical protein
VEYDRNEVKDENVLCQSFISLNLEITKIRKKFEKIYCHQDLSICFNIKEI